MPPVFPISAPRWVIAVALGVSVSSVRALAVAQTSPVTAAPQQPAATTPAPSASDAPAAFQAESENGGTIHGTVRAGVTPLPGVRITATNTLTGQRYSTTTDVSGVYRMTIPQNGRYVLRTEFSAFAPATGEALLNGSTHDASADLALTLQSRVTALPEDRGELGTRAQATRTPGAGGRGQGRAGAQTLSLVNALSGALEAGQGGASGAQLPSIGGSQDFSSDSVAVSGSSNASNSFAGINLDDVRQRAESEPSLNGGGCPGSGGPVGG